jgi:uncharacterized protein YuzE
VRVEFDRAANIAYIYLKEIADGEAWRQELVAERHTRGMVVLDFDKKGRLIGIEVMAATRTLPQGFLDDAER